MAFISEVSFLGGAGARGGEFVEITLGPSDDLADFVVSAYRYNGVLHTGAGITGGEVTLSSLTGVRAGCDLNVLTDRSDAAMHRMTAKSPLWPMLRGARMTATDVKLKLP